MKLYAYSNKSASAKVLAEALGIKRLKHDEKLWTRTDELVINWGSTSLTNKHWMDEQRMLNCPTMVANACDKLRTFQLFDDSNVPTVEWTTEKAVMMHWMAGGADVVFRHSLNGHSGEGIEIRNRENTKMNEVPDAPLYTKYVPKKDEYRIHVFQGNVIFQQRKARKKDVPDDQVNWQVRNLAGGFIFANDGINAPESCKQATIKAVASLGLDFGGVDIGTKDGNAVVYEINTAPGLMGKTLDAYVKAFRELSEG